MNSAGFVRKVDELGRIVIPKEIRKNLKISNNSPLAIFADSNSIIIKNIQPTCVICGSKNSLMSFKEKFICQSCAENIYKKNH